MENPFKMDDLGLPLFLETPIIFVKQLSLSVEVVVFLVRDCVCEQVVSKLKSFSELEYLQRKKYPTIGGPTCFNSLPTSYYQLIQLVGG